MIKILGRGGAGPVRTGVAQTEQTAGFNAARDLIQPHERWL